MSVCPVDFKQYIGSWSKDKYSNHNDPYQTIRTSGSAPTLCADIVATLIDNSVTPSMLAKLALEWGCRTYNSGTSWNYFKKVSEHYGFQKYVQSPKWEELTKCLDAGGYVICSMSNGYWCKSANYILAWDYDKKYVYCHDASSMKRRKQAIENFKAESRMYFCFYPDITEKAVVPMVEEKKAKWIPNKRGGGATCTRCRFTFNDVFDYENYDLYCRHCGAMMDGFFIEKPVDYKQADHVWKSPRYINFLKGIM